MTLTLDRAELRRFKALLQRGVRVRVGACSSVLGFLVGDLGLAPDYVRQRITTVFLDDQVVDGMETAVLRDGSRLALSGAMPGLVGATLRRSGPYAAMRAGITRPAERARDTRAAGGAALIVVKLFNLLLDEVGPVLLERGIVVDREVLEEVGCASAPGTPAPGGDVELQVRFR